MDAAIAAVDPALLVRQALSDPDLVSLLRSARAVDVLAAGKAAAPMLAAFVEASSITCRHAVGIGMNRPASLSPDLAWYDAAHPVPDQRSVAAARRALDIARGTRAQDLLVVLLSGGASSLMSLPADDLSLEDKQETIRRLQASGADIHELNAVRKHLSAIKGGQLTASAAGKVLTLALSDVVGDDLSVIGSGPTVGDSSTFDDAVEVLERYGSLQAYPPRVRERLVRGASALSTETPKPGHWSLDRSTARVIGSVRTALDGMATLAAGRGYTVEVIDEPVTGEAREAGRDLIDHARRSAAARGLPLCVLAGGETTVRVTGSGSGGRNQELALAMVHPVSASHLAAAASVGTDGIDGPTDAAGAIVDSLTMARAREARVDPVAHLADNNSFAFFDALGDLVRTGPTGTNVGDVQIVMIGGW